MALVRRVARYSRRKKEYLREVLHATQEGRSERPGGAEGGIPPLKEEGRNSVEPSFAKVKKKMGFFQARWLMEKGDSLRVSLVCFPPP